MFHIIYKTTNLLNRKIYVGVHSTNDIKDKYLGSGVVLKKAIKKYGKDNFTRETLLCFETQEEAYEIESLLVDETFINRPDVYNVSIGGKGNTSGYGYYLDSEGNSLMLSKEEFIKRTDLSTRKHSEISKLKCSESRLNYLSRVSIEEFTDKYCGKVCSDGTRLKRSSALKGITRRKLTESEKQHRRATMLEFWKNLPEEERKTKCLTKSDEMEALRRKKISETSMKPKEKSTCPHCGKIGGVGALKRFHFDNCKSRK